jgi:hypothetical protein
MNLGTIESFSFYLNIYTTLDTEMEMEMEREGERRGRAGTSRFVRQVIAPTVVWRVAAIFEDLILLFNKRIDWPWW